MNVQIILFILQMNNIDENIANIISSYCDVKTLYKLCCTSMNFYNGINKLQYYTSNKNFYIKHGTVVNDTHLVNVCYDGDKYLATVILKNNDIPFDDIETALQWSVCKKQYEICEMLLNRYKFNSKIISYVFIKACENTDLISLEKLIKYDPYQTEDYVYEYFRCTRQKHSQEIINKWLLENLAITDYYHILNFLVSCDLCELFIWTIDTKKIIIDQRIRNVLMDTYRNNKTKEILCKKYII